MAADGGDDDKYDMTRDNRAEPPPLFDIWVVTTKHFAAPFRAGKLSVGLNNKCGGGRLQFKMKGFGEVRKF